MLFSDFHPNEVINRQLRLRAEGETFLGPVILGHLFYETSVAFCYKYFASPLHRHRSSGSFKRKQNRLTAFALLFQTTTDRPQCKQQLLGMTTVCLISLQKIWPECTASIWNVCVGWNLCSHSRSKSKEGDFIKLKGESPSEDITVMKVLLQDYSQWP